MRELPRRPGELLAAAAAGLAAGLVASFMMDRAQALMPAPDTGNADPATVVAAKRLRKAAANTTLPKQDQAVAGAIVHYALGGALGAAYGVAAEVWPSVTHGGGVPFGLAAALVLDEAFVPLAGLSKPPWRHPAGTHVYGLISHIIFGASVETTRQLLRGPP